MSTDPHGLRPQDARAQIDACRLVRDALLGRATHIRLAEDPGHLGAVCSALTALAVEGHTNTARLGGLSGLSESALATAVAEAMDNRVTRAEMALLDAGQVPPAGGA